MTDLIERLEAATEGSRELDAEIDERIWRAKWGRGKPKDISVLYYTTSIDAALTLVPEGCGWEITTAILVNGTRKAAARIWAI